MTDERPAPVFVGLGSGWSPDQAGLPPQPELLAVTQRLMLEGYKVIPEELRAVATTLVDVAWELHYSLTRLMEQLWIDAAAGKPAWGTDEYGRAFDRMYPPAVDNKHVPAAQSYSGQLTKGSDSTFLMAKNYLEADRLAELRLRFINEFNLDGTGSMEKLDLPRDPMFENLVVKPWPQDGNGNGGR
jgi:hypothetical protein